MQFQSQRYDLLRSKITSTLCRLSGSEEISEKILVMDDHFIGHRFRSNGMQVDWLFQEDQLIARDSHGNRIEEFESALNLPESQEQEVLKRAA